MKIVSDRMRHLRESVKLSQMKISAEFGIAQSSLARYEMDQSVPPLELLLKYADYFDVSLDYLFGRTDDPHGAHYDYEPKFKTLAPDMEKFVEMCFDPNSRMNERLKETILKMLAEEDDR